MGIRGPMPKAAALQVDEDRDAPILRALDAWLQIMDKAIAEVENKSLVKVTPNGHEQKAPQLNVLADATTKVLELSRELGRTPAARVRLGAETDPLTEDDENDGLPPLPTRKKQPAKPRASTAAKERPKRAPRPKKSA
jgi:phage terminase small subunit